MKLTRAIDWLFEGTVKSWVYSAIRIGTAAIFLVRHADWLRSWVYLEHHRFVRGLMFLGAPPAEPRLNSPLIAGLSLGETANNAFVYLRTLLSVLLLLGVRARLSAGLLALVSYTLFAADRYRYYHHLHLLYVTLAWLALAPIGSSLSLEHAVGRLVQRWRGHGVAASPSTLLADTPIWPLQLIRALVLSVYLAAGVSKLDATFLNGDALRHLERLFVLKGPFWGLLRDVAGYGVVAKLSCLAEFAVPLGLVFPATRRAAIVGGLAFHAGISACMPVYSFGAQMSVLLLAFWPTEPRAPRH